jgi:hypothetical protein
LDPGLQHHGGAKKKKREREVMFLTAFKMAGINCSEMNLMLSVGVPRAIKPWDFTERESFRS